MAPGVVRAGVSRTFLFALLGAVSSSLAPAWLACTSFSPDDVVGSEDAFGGDAVSDGVVVDSARQADSGGEADSTPSRDARFAVSCGNVQPCNVVGDGCCFDRFSKNFACARKGSQCPSLTDQRYPCDDPDDCTVLGSPGTVCCATLSLYEGAVPSAYYLGTAQCTLRENCVAGDEVERCDPAVSGQCSAGKACLQLMAYAPPTTPMQPSEVTPSFRACQR